MKILAIILAITGLAAASACGSTSYSKPTKAAACAKLAAADAMNTLNLSANAQQQNQVGRKVLAEGSLIAPGDANVVRYDALQNAERRLNTEQRRIGESMIKLHCGAVS